MSTRVSNIFEDIFRRYRAQIPTKILYLWRVVVKMYSPASSAVINVDRSVALQQGRTVYDTLTVTAPRRGPTESRKVRDREHTNENRVQESPPSAITTKIAKGQPGAMHEKQVSRPENHPTNPLVPIKSRQPSKTENNRPI